MNKPQLLSTVTLALSLIFSAGASANLNSFIQQNQINAQTFYKVANPDNCITPGGTKMTEARLVPMGDSQSMNIEFLTLVDVYGTNKKAMSPLVTKELRNGTQEMYGFPTANHYINATPSKMTYYYKQCQDWGLFNCKTYDAQSLEVLDNGNLLWNGNLSRSQYEPNITNLACELIKK